MLQEIYVTSEYNIATI